MILYHKNTKTAIPLYQNCGLCLAENNASVAERFCLAAIAATHLQNIVALRPVGRDAPCFVTRSPSLHPPQAALGSLPLAPYRCSVQISPPTKKAPRLRCFSLANDYNFDTNALFLEFMGQSNFRGRYASHSPNKSGFKTLSIVAYPTIFAPSWILIFLPIHIQCG